MKEEHRFDASQCWSSVASNSIKGIFCIARVKQVVPVGGIPAEAFILVTRVRRRSVCEEMANTIYEQYEAIPDISLGATKITGGGEGDTDLCAKEGQMFGMWNILKRVLYIDENKG